MRETINQENDDKEIKGIQGPPKKTSQHRTVYSILLRDLVRVARHVTPL
jgi:hypothetical protein